MSVHKSPSSISLAISFSRVNSPNDILLRLLRPVLGNPLGCVHCRHLYRLVVVYEVSVNLQAMYFLPGDRPRHFVDAGAPVQLPVTDSRRCKNYCIAMSIFLSFPSPRIKPPCSPDRHCKNTHATLRPDL